MATRHGAEQQQGPVSERRAARGAVSLLGLHGCHRVDRGIGEAHQGGRRRLNGNNVPSLRIGTVPQLSKHAARTEQLSEHMRIFALLGAYVHTCSTWSICASLLYLEHM